MQLAMNGVTKRSGVRRRRRQELHRDVEDAARARQLLAARDLHLVVVIAIEQPDAQAGDGSNRQGPRALDQTAGRTRVQHPHPQLRRQRAEGFVVDPSLIQAVNHFCSEPRAPSRDNWSSCLTTPSTITGRLATTWTT